MMKRLWRVLVPLVLVVTVAAGSGAIGFYYTMKEVMSTYPGDRSAAALAAVADGAQAPAYDPAKPTVAVVLGNDVTEVFDFLAPYELFSAAGAFNVYAVAPDREVKSLTGGLDVLPQYTYAELDARLGRSPDIVVLPFIPIMDEARYGPTREWLRSHKETTIVSICNGAENFADTGLLDGLSASTHWGDINRLERKYTDIRWMRDQRYVVNGNYITSAGLTSGIDAMLYVISRQAGEQAAVRAADAIHYPSYRFVHNPQTEAHRIELGDAVYVMNQAFQWNKASLGVLLYDGIDELALSSVFDTYSAAGTANMLTIAASERPVVTKYGLQLVSRHRLSDRPKVDRLLVTGAAARSAAAALADIQRWQDSGSRAEPVFIHDGPSARFAMEAPLEDLARSEDVLTARFAAKRLEYREPLEFVGNAFPRESFALLLLVVALPLTVYVWVVRRMRRRRQR